MYRQTIKKRDIWKGTLTGKDADIIYERCSQKLAEAGFPVRPKCLCPIKEKDRAERLIEREGMSKSELRERLERARQEIKDVKMPRTAVVSCLLRLNQLEVALLDARRGLIQQDLLEAGYGASVLARYVSDLRNKYGEKIETESVPGPFGGSTPSYRYADGDYVKALEILKILSW